MPGSYPPAPPTINPATQLMEIHQLLRSPARVRRRLRNLRDLRFVADQVLTRRYRTSGGAVLYETGEPITNTRDVQAVMPGSEYPRDTPSSGTAALAAVSKWGQAVFLADEKLKRSVYMGAELDRSLRKVANTVIQKVDRLSLAAVASAVTATSAAVAPWDDDSAARMYRDLELAAAKIVDVNQGFDPDSVLMSTEKYALMISDTTIANMLRRETTSNPIYGGSIERLGKYRVIYTSATNLPSDDVWVFDSRELGGMADEAEVDPGYATADNGLQVKNKRVDERDGWDIWARRITVPVVNEPAAAIRITDTSGS